MVIDCHTHPLAHEGGQYSIEQLTPFVTEAITKGLKGIGFTDHEWYLDSFDFTIIDELREMYPEITILMGIEFDYRPSREQEIGAILKEKPYDYAIGSVHEIDGWPFDFPIHRYKYEEQDTNYVYERYFNLMAEMAATGLFQIAGHLDLIKLFGHRYQGDLIELIQPLLKNIKTAGMSVELNTNGYYKPVKEFYPSPEILKACIQKEIPISLSSDAHEFSQVGRDFNQAKALLKELGCEKLAYYQGKKLLFTDLET